MDLTRPSRATHLLLVSQAPRIACPELCTRPLTTCIHMKYVCVCVCVYVCAQLYLTLCDRMDYGLSGSSVHEISQARILEWVAISSSRGSLDSGTVPASPVSPALAGGFFTTEPPGKPIWVHTYAYTYIHTYSEAPESRCQKPSCQNNKAGTCY